MTREQILNTIKSLAQSQGFYGRLLEAMHENPEGAEQFLNECEAQNFKDAVDFILFIES